MDKREDRENKTENNPSCAELVDACFLIRATKVQPSTAQSNRGLSFFWLYSETVSVRICSLHII